jgi:Zn-dependent peptidase ImmA (M78 family)
VEGVVRAWAALLLLLAACRAPEPKRLEADVATAVERARGLLQEGVTVDVFFVPLPTHWGDAREWTDDHWLVRIDRDAPKPMQVWTIVHEFGHVLAGDAGSCNETSHGSLWGVAQAEVYREVIAP